ncbi:MAG TPA: FtsQ-type POTRA domain-containing protein [Methylomirabilota bacterium]|nr:FtsQ-type POTRA domain-containing protein [Methylomirabilota bacterium]
MNRAVWWRVRRRENRRLVRSSRSRHRWSAGVVLSMLLPGVLGLGGTVLARYAEQHPYFTVQEVIVEGSAGFSSEDVQEWSGVTIGTSMWEIDPEQVEARLLAHSWIQSARVRRDFPQRLHVSISVRRPVAAVLHDGLMFLDETGSCFTKPEQGVTPDLPYVSGVAGEPLDSPTMRSALDGVLRLLSLTRLWQESLSEIHWDAQHGYSLFLQHRRITIRLGWETTPEKFAQIGVVLARWPKEAPAAVFDARFADQIVVQPYAVESGAQDRALSRPL